MSFNDLDGAESWIKRSSILSASVLASRAAARGLPIIFNKGERITDNEILRVFRGMHAAITASSVATMSPELEAALVSASEFTHEFSDFANRACLVSTRNANRKPLTGKNVDSYYSGGGGRSENPDAIAASASDAEAIDIDLPNAIRAPLWRDVEQPSWFSNGWADGAQLMMRNSATWAHWVKWFEDIIEGSPIDWELQLRVALMSDAIWDRGPATVASEIEKIHLMLMTQHANDLLIEHVRSIPSELAGIGHNKPPEGITDFPIIHYEFSQILTATSVVQTELEETSPDQSRLQDSLDVLGKVLASAAKWSAKKLDTSLDEFLKTLAKSGAIAVSGAAGAWLLDLNSKLATLIEMLSKYIGTLS
ncbi:MAG: hypothetical protein ABJ251_18170 [Paracoccaceae bacterium]